MKHNKTLLAYLVAVGTITVWGSTFISSKVLLNLYTPCQIMLCRFLLAWTALWILRPRPLRLSPRQEALCVLLGLTGCSLYFFTENTALTYTLASNVSIIVTTAPILTALLAHLTGEERLHRGTFVGFLTAFTGVVLVVCNGAFVLRLNPRVDLLALAEALCWACYSVLLRRAVGAWDPVLLTRRTMFWGAVTGLPMALWEGAPFALPSGPVVVGNFLYLGIVASALCFVLWNRVIRVLGAVTANNFIYLNPFVTILTAWLILREPVSPLAVLGAGLITAGIVAAQRK
ncbi:MAG: DMT family transporter [Oscillibacter sp.]|nr:DMT family transporter [Oscillibacter sp.]